MKKPLAILALILTGCSNNGVVATGPDTYMLAKTADWPGVSRAKITADVYREANAFCADQQKRLVTVNITAVDWKALERRTNAKLEFRCVVEGPAN